MLQHFNEIFNQTNSTSIQSSETAAGIGYTLSGEQAFDSQANYSHVWYQQRNESGTTKAGKTATLGLIVFPGQDCQEIGSPIETCYGWSCQSEINGQCNTLPYSARSFSVQPGWNHHKKHCFDFAKEGKAATGAVGAKFIVWLAVVAVVVVILV